MKVLRATGKIVSIIVSIIGTMLGLVLALFTLIAMGALLSLLNMFFAWGMSTMLICFITLAVAGGVAYEQISMCW